MAQAANELVAELLRDVSRSFYTTLRILPVGVRWQVSLAYLLARTTDTIADTELVPVDQRLRALQSLRERIQGVHERPMGFGELARQQEAPAERALLENAEASVASLNTLSDLDLQLVRAVLDTIAGGQELDLRRFAPTAKSGTTVRPIVALQTDAELDDYTYRVAGCVGEFWTRICRARLFPKARLNEEQLLIDSVRFGKGLQLVNILRDLPADLRKGRCYLPADKLAEIRLAPEDLLQPAIEGRLRPLYERYLDQAEAHLAAGWDYTNALPRGQMRVRLACAWPVLIGVRTIGRLRTNNVLDADKRIKISRPEVRRIIACSILCYWLPGAWRSPVSLPHNAPGKLLPQGRI